MRKNLSTLFTFLLVLCSSISTAQDFEVNGIYYNVIERNISVEVTKHGSFNSYSKEYGGQVTIPETVTYYGGDTFRVTSIGDDAFKGCTGLTSITIPNSVTSIGYHAFDGCTGLTSITIPNSVTSIRDDAFKGCTGLTSITIPNSVTSIGDRAFDGCSNLKNMHIEDGTKMLRLGIKDYNSSKGLLYDCPLETLHLGRDISSIAPLFYKNESLTTVEIGNSVTSIGYHAFDGCTGLASIIIPNSVTSIGSGAFRDCTGLTSIIIPNSVTSIGSSAFSGCDGLTSITIPNGVTSIENSAFSGCKSLTSITIPNGVTSIEDSAFQGCSGLTSITIPNSVTSIGSYAFNGCTGITDIYAMSETPTPIDSYSSFNGVPSTATLHIPPGSKAVYQAVGGYWKKFTRMVEFDLRFTSSGINFRVLSTSDCTCEVTFQGSTYDEVTGEYTGDLVLPEKVTFMGKKYIVTGIAANAFRGCSSLTSVTFPKSITTIGKGAFYYCKDLTSITIPNSVTTIGDYAFYNCKGLTSITIPNSVTTIENKAFYYCTRLTSVTIPESVKEIKGSAFYGCTRITEIYSMAKVPAVIAENSFSNYSSINLYVPAGAKHLYRITEEWSKFTNIAEMESVEYERLPGDIDGDGSIDVADVTTIVYTILNKEDTEEKNTEQTFDAWASTNTANSSTSQKSYTLETTEGSVLTFDWEVSSESDCDWLIITLDGIQILKKSGNDSGSYKYTFTTTGTLELVVKYTKDSSWSIGIDQGKIHNIKLTGTANDTTDVNADVNGDGSIDIADVTALVEIILGTKQ